MTSSDCMSMAERDERCIWNNSYYTSVTAQSRAQATSQLALIQEIQKKEMVFITGVCTLMVLTRIINADEFSGLTAQQWKNLACVHARPSNTLFKSQCQLQF